MPDANTREAWDQMFQPGDHWDRVGGEEMTRTFAECIVAALPEWITRDLETARIVDWGCARGDGVDVFRKAWPNARVIGVDHSLVGIQQARERFGDGSPSTGFIWRGDDQLECGEPFDTVICSNVMEHLEDPVRMLRQHLTSVRDFYIILTPYMEVAEPEWMAMSPTERRDAGHHHLHRLGLDSFPDLTVDESERVWLRVFENTGIVPGPIWPGVQMLLVYESEDDS